LLSQKWYAENTQSTLRKLVNSPSFSLLFCENFATKIWWVDEMFYNVLVDEHKKHITLLSMDESP
jgi:hypothetical protein